MDFGVREEPRPSGEAERREMPGGAHCQGPPGDIGHWGGVLERLFEWSPLTSLALALEAAGSLLSRAIQGFLQVSADA